MAVSDRGFLSTPSQKAALASAAVFLGLWGALRLNLFRTPGLDRGVAGAIIVGALALGLALCGWSLLLRRKEPPLFSEEDIRPHADLFSEMRWRRLLAWTVVVLGLTPFVDWSMANGFERTGHFADSLPAFMFFLGLYELASTVAGGKGARGVDDELTASFRAEAWRVGFVTLLIAASGAYIVSRKDQWISLPLSATVPYVLALGAGATAVRFAWLERASARDG